MGVEDPHWVIKLCNWFVGALERTDLERFAADAIEAHDRAEICGCHQCRVQSNNKIQRFNEESWRVHVWQEDQEERWIMDQACRQLTEGHGET